MAVKLVTRDEVNIKFEGLSLEARKKLANTFKYEIPYARYHPAFKLGRWDGMISLFGIGGTGYLHQLEKILSVLASTKSAELAISYSKLVACISTEWYIFLSACHKFKF